MIIESIDSFDWTSLAGSLVCVTSGGFDPLHPGHVQSLLAMEPRAIAQWRSELERTLRGVNMSHGWKPADPKVVNVVIVNGTNFCKAKKGFEFMPIKDRLAMVGYVLSDRNHIVVPWDQVGDDSTVNVPLSQIKPHFFCKGGDRTPDKPLAEAQVCKDLGIDILWNCGGGKVQSSSDLFRNAVRQTETNSSNN